MVERSFGEQLARESERWVDEGLVTGEQAAALKARYGDGAGAGTDARSRAASVLAVVGAVAVGLGVIGFFAANWEAMSHALRLALLTLTTGGTYALAYHLRERTGRLPRVGESLYLLGVILFGASLFLVGQMFNVEAHDPLALLIWGAAATCVALIVRSKAIAWAALLLFTGWVGFEVGSVLEDSDGEGTAAGALSVFYGAALYGLGTAAQERVHSTVLTESGFAAAARRLGLLLGAAGVFLFTFSAVDEELEGAARHLDRPIQAVLLLVAALALAGAGLLAGGRRRTDRHEAVAVAAAVALSLLALYAGGNADLYALVFNIVFAAVALGAILAGYRSDEPWLVNAGIAFVAIDLIARYFDVFWSALPRSAGMIGAGVLVLAIAWLLERQRKTILGRMDR